MNIFLTACFCSELEGLILQWTLLNILYSGLPPTPNPKVCAFFRAGFCLTWSGKASPSATRFRVSVKTLPATSFEINVTGNMAVHRALRTPWHKQLRIKLVVCQNAQASWWFLALLLMSPFLQGIGNAKAAGMPFVLQRNQCFPCAQIVPVKLRNFKGE